MGYPWLATGWWTDVISIAYRWTGHPVYCDMLHVALGRFCCCYLGGTMHFLKVIQVNIVPLIGISAAIISEHLRIS